MVVSEMGQLYLVTVCLDGDKSDCRRIWTSCLGTGSGRGFRTWKAVRYWYNNYEGSVDWHQSDCTFFLMQSMIFRSIRVCSVLYF